MMPNQVCGAGSQSGKHKKRLKEVQVQLSLLGWLHHCVQISLSLSFFISKIVLVTDICSCYRGKYRPPNALPDGEKPLYLHISASSHLKDVIERIKAVDKAGSTVEDMLKQSKVAQPFTACVFLGFEADPSLNVSSRIRGPNELLLC
jgi:hypothetical protein